MFNYFFKNQNLNFYTAAVMLFAACCLLILFLCFLCVYWISGKGTEKKTRRRYVEVEWNLLLFNSWRTWMFLFSWQFILFRFNSLSFDHQPSVKEKQSKSKFSNHCYVVFAASSTVSHLYSFYAFFVCILSLAFYFGSILFIYHQFRRNRKHE